MSNNNNDDDNWYEIYDLTAVVDFIRKLVYDSFSDPVDYNDIEQNEMGMLDIKLTTEETQELNKLLSIEECLSVVKPRLKPTKDNTYLLNGNIFEQMVYDINGRMISNTMRSLVERDLLEVAFDDNKNDFVFWLKRKGKKDGDISTDKF